MCGIFALLNYANSYDSNEASLGKGLLERMFSFIDARGPDFKSPPISIDVQLAPSRLAQITFKASVLHLRGDDLCKQPLRDSHSNVLLFNGEIYNFVTNSQEVISSSQSLLESQSDTQQLLKLLSKADDERQICTLLSTIIGPFAFIYWHQSTKTLFFGRDIFGRRSLCIHHDPIAKMVVISSVAPLPDINWKEVSTSGIHQIGLSCPILVNEDTSCHIHSTIMWDLDNIFPRTKDCDSVTNSHIDDAKIEMPLRKKLNPIPCLYSENDLEFSSEQRSLLLELDRILNESLFRRISLGKQLLCKSCMSTNPRDSIMCSHSSVAIAFSGGIDSTVLALLASKHVTHDQPIDLLNVAFGPDAPDRLTAKEALLELIKLEPNREWNFVCIDIRKEDLEQDRENHIKYLISPLKTVIDDSIGCALWYISRGIGRKFSSLLASKISDKLMFKEALDSHANFLPDGRPNYDCPARILIIGMGIDEQLGGYSTHRSSWSHGGQTCLYDEISFQMRRLSTRNLGRDDRVGADHGRDMKSPFLDETLVDFLNDLPVQYKMNLDLAPGLGDKMILRKYAKQVLGLEGSSSNVKRAMQFGTRIAKLECKREQGHEICPRLL